MHLVAFSCLVALVALQRLGELRLSARNIRRALGRGGVMADGDAYAPMVALHAAALVAAPLEVWLFDRPWLPWLGVPMLCLLSAAQAARWWVMATLGSRWTTRVIYVPGDRLITRGPYRFLRHPNYLVVAVELVALPLVHTAWLTTVLASAVNAWVLNRRVAVEDALLNRYATQTAARS